jgi:hypothetical protein
LTALQSLRQNVRDAGRTRELARREAELRPTSARAHVIAARLAMADLDVPGARRSVERARALRVPLTHLAPSPAVWLALFDAEEAWQMGDPARALAVADQFAARRRDLPQAFQGQATAQLFFLYLSLGRLQQADGMLESMAASVDTVFRDQQRGRLIAMRADRRALATFLGARFRSTEQAQFVGSNLIDAGLLQMARAVISYHKQHRNLLPYDWYAGQLALVEGPHDEAVRRLTSASMLLPASGNQGLKIARQLADAHRGQGHLDKAVTLLEDATRRRSELTHAWEWLRARDRLAELYRDAGRLSDAERVERELMVLLSVADEDHGIKRRLARTDEVRVAR